MASKITGAQVEYDPASPLIDVDTAIEDLAEDLQRSGRNRQLVALQHLCGIVRRAGRAWHVYEGTSDPDELLPVSRQRKVQRCDFDTHVMRLAPQEPENAKAEPGS